MQTSILLRKQHTDTCMFVCLTVCISISLSLLSFHPFLPDISFLFCLIILPSLFPLSLICLFVYSVLSYCISLYFYVQDSRKTSGASMCFKWGRLNKSRNKPCISDVTWPRSKFVHQCFGVTQVVVQVLIVGFVQSLVSPVYMLCRQEKPS